MKKTYSSKKLTVSFPNQLGLSWHGFGRWQSILIHIAHNVKNMSITINIFLTLLNHSHILYFPSQHCRDCYSSSYALCQCGRPQISSPSAPWELGDSVCQLCLFYLSSKSGCYPSSSFLHYRVGGEGSSLWPLVSEDSSLGDIPM